MTAAFVFDFDLEEWAPWIAPVVGVAFAGFVYLLGHVLVARVRARRRHELPPPVREPAVPDPFRVGSAGERRTAYRRKGNPVAVWITDAFAKQPSIQGWVVDRSTGGLCLAVYEAVLEGTILSVRTTNAPVSVPWVQVEVRNCRKVDTNYEIGCQFVKTPPWSVLLLFG